MTLREHLERTRVLGILRGDRIADAAGLTSALADVGLSVLEFPLTTARTLEHIHDSSTVDGAIVGAGTVLTAVQAKDAIDAGARFLVCPAVLPEVADIAQAHGVDCVLGAFTPTEILQAQKLGSAVVKVFPAHTVGPDYFHALHHGPYPGIPLLATGGITAANAAAYLTAGALAVAAGGAVATADALASGKHEEIAARARHFLNSLSRTESTETGARA